MRTHNPPHIIATLGPEGTGTLFKFNSSFRAHFIIGGQELVITTREPKFWTALQIVVRGIWTALQVAARATFWNQYGLMFFLCMIMTVGMWLVLEDWLKPEKKLSDVLKGFLDHLCLSVETRQIREGVKIMRDEKSTEGSALKSDDATMDAPDNDSASDVSGLVGH